MKIAIDCRYIGKSGIGSYIENIVYEFVNFHLEHEYLLLVEKEQMQYQNYQNVEQIITSVSPFSIQELLCFPVKKINKCDLFFTPYINIPGKINVPIYCTIHDVLFLDYKTLVSKIGYFIRRFFLYRAIKKSIYIFTVSNFSKQRIITHFPSCDGAKIVVAYNGITYMLREYAEKQSITQERKNIVCIGNVKPHKGLDILLNAYKDARKLGLEDKLIIIGNKDNFRTSSEQIYNQCEENKDIIFTGYLNNDEMYSLLASAKMLVSPSRYEGFGIPPLEALYMGTNVVISDIEVYQELYNELPVTYFKDGKVNDLSEKILKKESKDLRGIREKILFKYNYTNTANIILSFF